MVVVRLRLCVVRERPFSALHHGREAGGERKWNSQLQNPYAKHLWFKTWPYTLLQQYSCVEPRGTRPSVEVLTTKQIVHDPFPFEPKLTIDLTGFCPYRY